MIPQPAQAAYWQQLYAADVARNPRKLPRSWLDVAFGRKPAPVQHRTLTETIASVFRLRSR